LELDIDISVDSGGTTVNVLDYPMNVHPDASSCSLGGMSYSGISPPTGGYNVGTPTPAGSIHPFSRWLVTSGQPATNTVIYNGVHYLTGEVITGVTGAGNDQMAFAGTGAVVPCVHLNKYTSIATGKRVERAIQLKGTNHANTCFWDYRSAAVDSLVRGYWSGETYRFGVLFYDLKGNPYFARWLVDITFPSILAKGGILRKDEIGNTGVFVYSLNPTLFTVSNLTIPQSVMNQISGFSIVRAERDARIITQGLVTQNVDTGASPKVYRPAAYDPPVADTFDVADRIYTYLCPDNLVGQPFSKPIGVIGDTMEE